jgi:hypothetical protein
LVLLGWVAVVPPVTIFFYHVARRRSGAGISPDSKA